MPVSVAGLVYAISGTDTALTPVAEKQYTEVIYHVDGLTPTSL
ncbi:MAG: hypothetical protein U5J96_15795 [Ignavibacteriaceae bacterium]|nr:hypothetical protein [Ignavibacteriaceae bacterium]